MNGTLAAFYLLLVTAAFALSVFVSRTVGNVLVLAAYGVFFVAAIAGTTDLRAHLRSHDLPKIPFHYHPAVLVPAVVLWAVFTVGFALNPSFRAFLRLGAFTVLSAITLFVVPAVVPRERAFRAIATLGAAFVALALPAILLGDVAVAGILIDWAGLPFERFGVIFHVPATFFDTRNYFRTLVALGTVCAAGVYAYTRSPWMVLAGTLNLFGVYVTLGRAARYAVLGAAGLAVVYLLVWRIGGHEVARRVLTGVTVLGILMVVVGFAVGLGLLSGPTRAIQSALDERLIYWGAAYDAVLARPVFGWGLVDTDVAVAAYFEGTYRGVHNSYLRLFVVGGVVGGLAYLALSAGALVAVFRSLIERTPLALAAYALVVMALFFQLFAGGTIFGTSLSSVLWALTIAYAQPGVVAAE